MILKVRLGSIGAGLGGGKHFPQVAQWKTLLTHSWYFSHKQAPIQHKNIAKKEIPIIMKVKRTANSTVISSAMFKFFIGLMYD